MSYHALWIDHTTAELHHFTAQGHDIQKIDAPQHPEHHAHNPRDLKDRRENEFFHEVAQELSGAKELLVMGPGMAKTEFTKFLEFHHVPLAKAIVGVIPMESHFPQARLMEKVRGFFHHHHLFTANY